ncbi:hypothetical protein D5F01_LYC24999 [Larimichthys crocea]|uniref:Uncharacterized protein n=1 Tax=Larimichthys crocea TaxID=215358 RepID=A0A6G0HD70_LARCR|nr:hypothetical protein D5F01_LYC24999 [Larimichthys crocea]
MEEEFKGLHKLYQERLTEDERAEDTEQCYEPKRIIIDEFKTKSHEWSPSCTVPPPPEREDEIGPTDSVSSVSRRSKGSMASSDSACLVAQAEKAALLAKAAFIKERHGLEEKEGRLAKEKEEIRRQKETLDSEAELSAVNAKLAVLTGAEEQVASTPADGMETYYEERRLEIADMDPLQPAAHLPEERVVRPKGMAHHISIPPFQVPRSRGGLQGDHTAPRAQPTRSLPAEHAVLGGEAVLKPGLEKPLGHSGRTELSTEHDSWHPAMSLQIDEPQS